MPPSPAPRRTNYGRYAQPMQATAPKPAPAAPKAPKPLKIEGTPDLWITLQKVSDPNSGWVKTTRAMTTPAGVLVNTCSRKTGAPIAAEALVLVPGTRLYHRPTGWVIE